MKPAKRSTTKDFQEMLLLRRMELGFTQRQLAQRVGIRASHVAYLEQGKRNPSVGVVLRLASVLKLNARLLMRLAIPELAAVLR